MLVHSCRLLVGCPQKGNSLFGNSFEGTASERHAPAPTWSCVMWAFKRLQIFKPVLSPPRGRHTGAGVPWVWLSDVIPPPAFLIVSCLSWAFVYFFPPQKLGYFFIHLSYFISHLCLFPYLHIFERPISFFTSSVPSLFWDFLPFLSSFAVLIFWMFVCFPCFYLSLFCLSILLVYVFHLSPGLFCFFMLSDVCIRPRRCVPTFISRNCSKPQNVRLCSPL